MYFITNTMITSSASAALTGALVWCSLTPLGAVEWSVQELSSAPAYEVSGAGSVRACVWSECRGVCAGVFADFCFLLFL